MLMIMDYSKIQICNNDAHFTAPGRILKARRSNSTCCMPLFGEIDFDHEASRLPNVTRLGLRRWLDRKTFVDSLLYAYRLHRHPCETLH